MNKHCALCGRITLNPAVMIGIHPVGIKCARRAGLMAMAIRKSGIVFPVTGRKSQPKQDCKTLDMFEVIA
jgi:hypothetical protein